MNLETTQASIKASNCLSETDSSFIAKNIKEIQKNWEKRQVFRTETEMIVSVLNDAKHPTNAAKYWQAIREQAVFYQELVLLSFEYRRNDIAVKRLEIDIVESEGYEKELFAIDLEEKLFAKINMQSVAADRVRELRLWDSILTQLDDGSFDTKDVNAHQLESFVKRFELQAQLVTEHTPPADAINILGQNETAKRVVNERKLLEE